MSLVNEATVTLGIELDPDVLAVELVPHAAKTIAIAPANTNAVDDLSLRNCIPPQSSVILVRSDEKGWATVG